MIKEEVKMKTKYAVITSKETCEIRNEEVFPENLGRQDLLVSAHYSMISAGTELAGFSALSPGVYQKGAWNAYPWRSGYGLVGKAEKIGEEVHHIKEGERVFCFGNHAQRQIWPLEKFMENSTYSAFPVHNDLDDQTLTASRMALVAITGPQVSGVELGDTVAVFGLGMVGNIAAQYYQHLGARVIAFDTSAMRCQKARQVGLEEVFDISPEKQVKVVQDLTNGRGANITVDAVGSSSVVLNCVNATARYGKVVLLGTPRAEVAGNLTELLRPVHMRCLQILGAFEWRVPAYDQVGVPHSIESNLKMIWDLIQRGKLNVLDLITHVVKPEEMQLAYMGLLNDKERYLGVLVDWQE
jgi:2-desacetyl-2-hydroxyethyl bacteriochlorophyllide A dehydrogenase